MRISHHKRFVYFSYARTGSRTACQLLDPYCDVPVVKKRELSAQRKFYKHMTYGEVRAALAGDGYALDDYRTVVFCRNPFERVRSLYRHHVVTSRAKAVESWPDFVARFAAVAAGGTYGSLRMPLVEFAGDGKDVAVDTVLRFEDYEAGLAAMLAHFDLPARSEVARRDDAKALTKVGGDPGALAYDRPMAETLLAAYGADFERFGYDRRSWQREARP